MTILSEWQSGLIGNTSIRRVSLEMARARRVSAEPSHNYQTACKPGSGRRDCSRAAAIPLGRRLPGASSSLPGRRSEDRIEWKLSTRAVPIRLCSRWGLPCRLRCRRRGALLPHRFTLAWSEDRGGLFSVALSLGSPPPDVIRHRISVEPGLSSTPARRGRPAD